MNSARAWAAREPAVNWFRMYHEARLDRKLLSLTDAQFRVWFNLICYASEQPVRGEISERTDELLAIECAGGDVGLLCETLERLVSLRCVTWDATPVTRDVTSVTPCHSDVTARHSDVTVRHIVFTAWPKRQRRGDEKGDTTSAQRMRKHRANKRLRSGDGATVTPDADTGPSRASHGAVTGALRVRHGSVTPQNRSRTDPDPESEKTPPTPPAGGVAGRGPGPANDPLDSPDVPHPEDVEAARRAEPAPVANDPAEVARVGRFAEEALAGIGYARFVEQDARRNPIAFIERAIVLARDGGRTDWRYVRAIFERFTRQGGVDDSGRSATATTAPVPERSLPRSQQLVQQFREYADAQAALRAQEGTDGPR